MRVLDCLVLICIAFGGVSCSKGPGSISEQGLARLQDGKAADASRKFGRALQMVEDPNVSALLWNAIGVSAAKTGQEEEAENAFRTALEIDPGVWVALVNLGILTRNQGRKEEAAAWFDQALRVFPEGSVVLEYLAAEAVREGNRDQAVTWMQQAVGQRPTSRTLSSLAVMTVDLLSVEERRQLLLEAVSADPQNPAAQINLAALLDQHRFDAEQAKMHYEAFLRLTPDGPLAVQVQERIRVMEARATAGIAVQPDPVRSEVEALLERAGAAEDPRQALALCLRAHATAARANRVDLREQALRAGTTLAPSSPRGFVGLGRLLNDAGRHEEALNAFRQAFDLAPSWEPAWQGVEDALRALGRQAEADRFLQTLPSANG